VEDAQGLGFATPIRSAGGCHVGSSVSPPNSSGDGSWDPTPKSSPCAACLRGVSPPAPRPVAGRGGASRQTYRWKVDQRREMRLQAVRHRRRSAAALAFGPAPCGQCRYRGEGPSGESSLGERPLAEGTETNLLGVDDHE
jgi:hypothetical protein